MINMESILKRGYTAWDRDLLPPDEYTERVRLTQAEMARAGLDALVVFASNYENADFAYLTAMSGGGQVVLPRVGEPFLLTPGGGREMAFTRTLTWITQVAPGGAQPGKAILAALEQREVPKGRVGTVCAHVLSPPAFRSLGDNLGNYELVPFDAEFGAMRASKRPREVSMLRRAIGIVSEAREAAEKAFSEGSTTTMAMIHSERSARLNRAKDFRVLANVDGDDLRPFEGTVVASTSPLVMWLAVQYDGYWADVGFVSPKPTRGEADTAVEAMIVAAKAGARCSDLAKAAVGRISAAAVESALTYGFGGGIGLSLNDGLAIRDDNHEVVPEGAVLSLRALCRGQGRVSFDSAIIRVGPAGSYRLTPL